MANFSPQLMAEDFDQNILGGSPRQNSRLSEAEADFPPLGVRALSPDDLAAIPKREETETATATNHVLTEQAETQTAAEEIPTLQYIESADVQTRPNTHNASHSPVGVQHVEPLQVSSLAGRRGEEMKGQGDFSGSHLGEKDRTDFNGNSGGDLTSTFLDLPFFEVSGIMNADPRSPLGLFNLKKVDAGAYLSALFPGQKRLLQQIADRFTLWQPKGIGSVRFQLEPDALGALRIEIAIHDQKIIADIVTEHVFVKELLEGNQKFLRETLAEYGLSVDRFSVGVGDPHGRFFDTGENLRDEKWGPPVSAGDSILPSDLPESTIRFNRTSVGASGLNRINVYI